MSDDDASTASDASSSTYSASALEIFYNAPCNPIAIGDETSRPAPLPPQARPEEKGHHADDRNDETMPDGLAALVAAAIRDRVVLEQMEEIRSLRAALAASDRVEVTGPGGTPVYARGDFSRGEFGRGGGGGSSRHRAFWDVGMETMATEPSAGPAGTVPLNDLRDVEIRVGGTLYASSSEVEATSVAFGIRPGNRFDLERGDMSRSAVAELHAEDGGGGGSGNRAALLTFHVRDFPRGCWRSLQSVAMLNRSVLLRRREREAAREERREAHETEWRERAVGDDGVAEAEEGEEYDSEYEGDEEEDDEDPLHVYNYLTVCLAKQNPGQRADITSVSLCVQSVRGRIENLRRGGDFRSKRERVLWRIDEMRRETLAGTESAEEEEFAMSDDEE